MDAMFCLRVVFLSSVVVLAACGGGSGGGGGDSSGSDDDGGTSLSATQRAFDTKREAAFEGSREPASLDNTTILPFIRVIISNQLPPEARTDTASPRLRGNLTKGEGLSSREMSAVHALVRSSMSLEPANKSTPLARLKVNETRPCTPSGSVAITGKLNDTTGEGLLTYDYRNCVLDGFTLQGLAKAWVGLSGDIEHLFYDGLEFRGDGYAFRATGDIDYTLDSQVELRSMAYSFDSGFEYQEEDYRESDTTDIPGGRVTGNGKLYYAGLGWVRISLDTVLFYESISGDGDMTLSNDTGTVSVDMSRGSATFRRGTDAATISVASLFLWDDTSLVMRPASTLGQTPSYDSIGFQGESLTAADDLDVILRGERDVDHDSLSVSYRWFVNDIWLQQYRSETLPQGVVAYRDKVSVIAEITDGLNTVSTNAISAVIGDAPTKLKQATLPTEVAVGVSQTFQATFWDADEPGSDSAALLEYGPQGATISGTGLVSWMPAKPLLGQSETVYFGFRTPSGQRQEHAVVVRDSAGLAPIVKTGVVSPKEGTTPLLLQFDDDPALEILVLSEREFLYTLEYKSGRVEQEWAQLWRFPSVDDRIVDMAVLPASAGAHDAVLLATNSRLYRLDSPDAPLQELMDPDGIILGMNFADADRDGDSDAIVTLYNSSTNLKQVIVFDVEQRHVISTVLLPNGTTDVQVGNVDSDPNLELVVTGDARLVIDLSSRFLQSTLPADVYGTIHLGDVTGDGVDDIICSRPFTSVLVYDYLSNTMATYPSGYGESLVLGNADNDPALEILLSGSEFSVLEWQSGSVVRSAGPYLGPTLQLYGQLMADIDADGSAEALLFNARDVFLMDIGGVNPGVWVGQVGAPYRPAGWGAVTPGNDKAMFVARAGRYDGAYHLASVGVDGMLSTTSSLGYYGMGYGAATVVDENADGFAEVHLGTAQTTQYGVRSYTLDGLVQRYASPVNTDEYSYDNKTVLAMVSTDMNADSFVDMVWATENAVYVDSPSNGQRLSTFSSDGDTVSDIDVMDVDSDGKKEIILANRSGLHVLKYTSGSWTVHASRASECDILEVARLDLSSGNRIVCLAGQYSSTKTMTIFSGSLGKISEYSFNKGITDVVSVSRGNGTDELVLSVREGKILGTGPTGSRLERFSQTSGDTVSSSELIFGELRRGSVKPFVDGSGARRFVIGTDAAMYLSR